MAKVVIPYTPRYADVHARLEAARFVVLVAHRRFGKTVLAINHILKKACMCRRQRGFFAYIAPFRNQAKSVAWAYLKHYSDPIVGRVVNESDLSVTLINGACIRLFGADNPDALRGMYFDGVVMDEVAQMRPEIWDEIVQPALADRGGWAVFIGTPKGINLFSELYNKASKLCNEGDKSWAALCYRVDETHALPAEEVERLKAELSPNAFRQEFLCDFAASSDDALITIDDVSAAVARVVREHDVTGMPLIMGVDVARFGSDASVMMLRRGLLAQPPIVMRQLDNMQVADRVAACIAEQHPDAVFIDAGQGQGVIDRLRHMGLAVIEVPFGGKALDAARFINRRSEMWYGVREWIRAGGALPADCLQLKKELTIPLYWYDGAGRIVLEPKDKIKERLATSPDIADALALTFAAPVAVSPAMHKRARTDYNPFGY